jgi:hypothetical protein
LTCQLRCVCEIIDALLQGRERADDLFSRLTHLPIVPRVRLGINAIVTIFRIVSAVPCSCDDDDYTCSAASLDKCNVLIKLILTIPFRSRLLSLRNICHISPDDDSNFPLHLDLQTHKIAAAAAAAGSLPCALIH